MRSARQDADARGRQKEEEGEDQEEDEVRYIWGHIPVLRETDGG